MSKKKKTHLNPSSAMTVHVAKKKTKKHTHIILNPRDDMVHIGKPKTCFNSSNGMAVHIVKKPNSTKITNPSKRNRVLFKAPSVRERLFNCW